MKTDCSKCATAMPKAPPAFNEGLLLAMFGRGVTTGYKCQFCGHWNNLKRRKGFKEWKESQLA